MKAISKDEFYERGGLSNGRLFRKREAGRYVYLDMLPEAPRGAWERLSRGDWADAMEEGCKELHGDLRGDLDYDKG